MAAHLEFEAGYAGGTVLAAASDGATAATPRAIVERLATNMSLEIAPVAAARIAFFSDILPAGTPVFVPVLPGTRLCDNVALVARLAQDGMRPVPHIAARRLASYGELDDALNRFREAAGVSQVLVIAGDPATPAGPFRSSMDVLESGMLERYDIDRVFVAGHPEPNPEIPAGIARDFLLEKNAWSRETGIAVEVATQFSFSAETILAWERRMREAGNRLPIRVGLAGPTKPATLIKFASLCGVRASANFAARTGLKLTKLASERAPDDVVTAIADAVAEDSGSMISGIHLFTFGGFAKSAAWIGKVADGAFTFDSRMRGFTVAD